MSYADTMQTIISTCHGEEVMPTFHKVIMTNYVPRSDGTGFDRHTATDTVGDDILDAYIADAGLRWATVEDAGTVDPPADYSIPTTLDS